MFTGITPSVPTGFVRKLKAMDPGLDCEFSREHERFVITQTGKISGKVPVIVVRGDDGGGYRYPSDMDIKVLQGADLHKRGQEVKNRIVDGETYMAEAKAKSDADAADEIKGRTREDKIQLSNEYNKAFNMGKGNSSHRRVEAKKRVLGGFTVTDNRKLSSD